MAFFKDTNIEKETEGGYAHSTWGQFATGGLGNKNIWLGKNTSRRERKKQQDIFDTLLTRGDSLYGSAYSDQLLALAQSRAGYKAAQNEVRAGGSATTRRVAAAQGSAAAADKKSAEDRGLPSGGAGRAAAADMGRVRQRAAAGVGALSAGVASQGAASEVRRRNDLASTQEAYMRQRAQIEMDRIDALRNILNQRRGGILKPVLTVVGSIWGAGAAGNAIGTTAEENIR